MSSKPTKTSEASALVKKSLYLSHFTPSMMPPETLEAMLVQREPMLTRSLASVVDSLRTDSRHHTLFVGPRGIGKTHLISLLHHRLSQTKEAQSNALIAWMREEEWGVTSFFELVLRILRTLDASYPALNIEALTNAVYELPLNEAEKKAESILLQVLADKCLVVLLENLDDLFEQLGDHSQKAWRAFIQNHSNTILVCTTPSLFSGVTGQKSAFYGFFDVEPLAELSYEDVVSLLEKIATERDDKPLAVYIQTSEGRARIRAVHHLAEGNPRIYIIFAQFLTQESLDDLVQAFMHTLDELTPYYQARIKELSGQQRKILEYLVNYTGAASVKQIAKSCFITQQICSSQLRQLRLKRYVRVIEQGRQSYYELCEPLMRLCMDIKKQRGEPVSLLVEMLRIWYTEDQLIALLEQSNGEINVSFSYVAQALALQKRQHVEPEVQAILKDFNASDSPKQRRSLMQDLAKLKTKNDSVLQIQSILRLGFDEIQPISMMTNLEIAADIQQALSLLETMMPTIKKSSAAYPVFELYFKISAKVFKHNKNQASVLFDALIHKLKNFPAAFSVAVLKTVMFLRDDGVEWAQALLGTHPGGFASKEVTAVLRRLTRMTEALQMTSVDDGIVRLMALPKEERALLQNLASRTSDTPKK